MRPIHALAAFLALSACGSGAANTIDGQPSAGTDDGLHVTVTAVRPDGDRTVVEMVAVNGSAQPQSLGRPYAPIVLVDASGTELVGPEEEIEVPAFSSDRLRVEFAGRPSGERMTLKADDVTIPDLPTGATTFTAGPVPSAGDLGRAQANHANGSTVRVTSVTFDETETAVQVEVVNGHDDAIELSGTSDPALLRDPSGRVYRIVGPQANPDLEIQQGQTLRGTLRFAGRVSADVDRLTLIFNGQFGSGEDYSTDPRLSVELPLVISRPTP